MEILLKIFRASIILGFAIGGVAFLWGALASGRENAALVFAIGFILISGGITGSLLATPNSRFERYSPWGMKLAAAGFAIAVIPSVIGGFIFHKSDDELSIFFTTGVSLTVIGILIHWYSIYSKQE